MMRSSAAAFAWEFRRRHRWGLIAIGVYLAVIGAIRILAESRGLALRLDSPETFAFMDVVPLSSTFTYLLAVFTFGLEGDLTGRASMYPPRLFTRPVTTAALAGWPMLFGSVAMLMLWGAARLAVPWPDGVEMPTVWPGVLAASILAWTQALTWMPYPLPGLRIGVSVLLLWALDLVVFLWIYRKPSEWVMLALLVPQVPIAYGVARVAVARARRGHVPDWRGHFSRLAGGVASSAGAPRTFRSPAAAQSWLEWHRIGRSLPGWVAILLPFELALLLLSDRVPRLVDEILLSVLCTPILMATFAAANVRRASPQSRDAWGVSPFDGARPIATSALVRAKLEATVWSTALTWTLVLAAMPLALVITGTMDVVVEQARAVADAIGTARAVVLVLLALAFLVATTWKQLVQSLYVGLTGRGWLVKGSLFATLVALFLLGPILAWLMAHGAARGALWEAFPAILAVVATSKVMLSGAIAVRLQRRGLLSDRTLMAGAVGWCATVLALYTLFAWFLDSALFPRYLLVLLATVLVPLARVSAAPLALAWNRHR